jgi:integrase
MATIGKTPSGTWKATIRKQGWPTTIKTFRIKRDAEDWARKTEDEMVRGVHIVRSQGDRLTFAEAMDRYLREVTPSKHPNTQAIEKRRAAGLKAYFGQHTMATMTADVIAKFRDARFAQGRKADTVRLDLALLGHLFKTAIREWRLGLPQNPVSNVRKPPASPGRDRRISANEERRLRQALALQSNPMLLWIFEIAIETGMRSSEITGLMVDQVDVPRRLVKLKRTKNESSRTVPMTSHAQDVFVAALANPLRPEDCNLVFFGEPGKDGKRRPYNFNKGWLILKARLGLRDLRFHDLRHEAVSRFVEAGLSDQEVSAISGHKSMQMLKRYTHLRAEDLVKKLDRIERDARFSEKKVGETLHEDTDSNHAVDKKRAFSRQKIGK